MKNLGAILKRGDSLIIRTTPDMDLRTIILPIPQEQEELIIFDDFGQEVAFEIGHTDGMSIEEVWSTGIKAGAELALSAKRASFQINDVDQPKTDGDLVDGLPLEEYPEGFYLCKCNGITNCFYTLQNTQFGVIEHMNNPEVIKLLSSQFRNGVDILKIPIIEN